MIDKLFGCVETILIWGMKRMTKGSITQKKLDAVIQFLKFGIVGLSNTVVSYVIYILVLLGFQKYEIFSKTDYLIAQFVGFAISVLWSFYWNNKFVFSDNREGRNLLHALAKTYVSYAFTGIFLNGVFSFLWVEVFHWSKMIAPIINLLVSVPLNFIMNKFWAFQTNKDTL